MAEGTKVDRPKEGLGFLVNEPKVVEVEEDQGMIAQHIQVRKAQLVCMCEIIHVKIISRYCLLIPRLQLSVYDYSVLVAK